MSDPIDDAVRFSEFSRLQQQIKNANDLVYVPLFDVIEGIYTERYFLNLRAQVRQFLVFCK